MSAWRNKGRRDYPSEELQAALSAFIEEDMSVDEQARAQLRTQLVALNEGGAGARRAAESLANTLERLHGRQVAALETAAAVDASLLGEDGDPAHPLIHVLGKPGMLNADAHRAFERACEEAAPGDDGPELFTTDALRLAQWLRREAGLAKAAQEGAYTGR